MVAGQPLPSWETLAIVSLMIVVLLSMLCVVLVCRKNRNLKDRLRQSAEVLTPTISQHQGSILGTTDGTATYSNNGHIYRPMSNNNGNGLTPVHHATLNHSPT